MIIIIQIYFLKSMKTPNRITCQSEKEARMAKFANVLAELLARFVNKSMHFSLKPRLRQIRDSSFAISGEFLLAGRFSCYLNLGED